MKQRLKPPSMAHGVAGLKPGSSTTTNSKLHHYPRVGAADELPGAFRYPLTRNPAGGERGFVRHPASAAEAAGRGLVLRDRIRAL